MHRNIREKINTWLAKTTKKIMLIQRGGTNHAFDHDKHKYGYVPRINWETQLVNLEAV